jgi:hypothetical protein
MAVGYTQSKRELEIESKRQEKLRKEQQEREHDLTKYREQFGEDTKRKAIQANAEHFDKNSKKRKIHIPQLLRGVHYYELEDGTQIRIDLERDLSIYRIYQKMPDNSLKIIFKDDNYVDKIRKNLIKEIENIKEELIGHDIAYRSAKKSFEKAAAEQQTRKKVRVIKGGKKISKKSRKTIRKRK